ncbi:hypothetical protein EJ07DRAFT_164671 [Lizonia empirigonia]|nr:hypothetical protein EJ07DRAFT_164671 [Lizonia empirigonia]
MVLRTRPEEDDWQNVKDAKKRKQIQDRLAQRARNTNLNERTLADPDLLPNNLHLPLPSPNKSNLQLPLTVFTALFMNGQILSLSCSTILASKSAPPTAAVPIPLRPIASQLTTVHFQWIDRLPFPKLRDSLIRLQGVVDLEDFLNDIFTMPSFEIRAGAACWDPRAWSMESEWARKWGWLFF